MSSYTLTRRRGQKSLRLSVKYPNQIHVSAGLWVPKYLIDRFVTTNQSWIAKKLAHFSSPTYHHPVHLSPAEKTRLKHLTLELITPYLHHYSQSLGVTWKKITIRNQSSRWGSCSRSGNLNFNLKLALLPPALIEYVVLHELAHLIHLNHSPRFWQLVQSHMPDYKSRKTQLRTHQT